MAPDPRTGQHADLPWRLADPDRRPPHSQRQEISIDESILNLPSLVRAHDVVKKPPAIRARTPVVPETARERAERLRGGG